MALPELPRERPRIHSTQVVELGNHAVDGGALLRTVDNLARAVHGNDQIASYDQFQKRAAALVLSSQTTNLVIDSNHFTDVDNVFYVDDFAGPSVGANLDPSHLFWQGIDPIGAIRVLGDAIFYVHAKDTQLYPANMPKTGVLDTKPYTQERDRSWIFRTVRYGHGQEWWNEFISTLRMYGYDNVLSIEHEDSLMSPDEGLSKAAALLSQVVIKEKPAAAWWV